MKVRALRGFCLGGTGNDANPGDILDLPDTQAKELMQRGKVEAHEATAKPAKPAKGKPDAN
jgi:hypothetical protein